MLLDVERAANALLPHTTTAVMGPRPSTAPARATTKLGGNNTNEGGVPGAADLHLDALAYRPRTPNITSMRQSSKFDRVKQTQEVDLGVPGPGHYRITESSVAKPQKSHSKPVGVLYHASAKTKKEEEVLFHKRHEEAEMAAAVGPGTYAAEKSHGFVSHRQPVTAIMRAAESKTVQTPQMLRKQYFEQKARDMREVHDNMREASMHLVTTRVPTASLAPPKWSRERQCEEEDPRRRQILQDHRLENMRSSSADISRRRNNKSQSAASALFDKFDKDNNNSSVNSSSESMFRRPSKKFNAVEKRVPLGAFMKAEVTARRSTSARIQSRPGVALR